MSHPSGSAPPPLGFWTPDGPRPADDPAAFRAAVGDLRAPVVVVQTNSGFAVARGGSVALGVGTGGLRPPLAKELPVVAVLPPLPPESLGDPDFRNDHALKYPYMTGAMANGIGSADIVAAR